MGVDLMRKHVRNASSSCYRSACRHPLLVFMVFVSFWLSRSFPVLFSLLAYVAPVIASTLVLLGTLLFYGHENAPEIQHHHHIHNLGIRVLGNAEIGEKTYLVNNMNVDDNNMELKQLAKSELNNRNPFLVNCYGQLQRSETGNDDRSGSDRSRRNSVDRVHDTRGRIDEDDNGPETGSDLVESSSPTASMADINSILDELRPMSGSEGPFPVVSSDTVSDHSLELSEFVNDTDDYNNYDYDVDDEEESVITWTEDDQRNIMNLGTLELERNLLLENLVVRQTALKNMRMLAEKNLKNISPDLHSNATHISITSLNHFDHTNHTHENNLGFAHSVMFPREQKPDHVGPTFQFESPWVNRRKSFDFNSSTFGPYSLPEPIAFDPKSTGSSHRSSDISEYIYQRRRFSEDDSTVNSGYEGKTSSKSSSSSFCDATEDKPDDDDDDDDGDDDDDDNEEEEFRSINSPMAHDSKELQIDESGVDYSATSNTDGGLPQRPIKVHHWLNSWLTGWKA